MTVAESSNDKKTVERAVMAWWHELQPTPNKEEGPPKPNRSGDRAELRRCATPMEVALLPSYHRLLQRVRDDDLLLTNGSDPKGKVAADTLAAIAQVIVHIKQNRENMPFAKALAEGGPDRPRLSDLRFRKLLRPTDREELAPMLVRVVKMLDGAAPLLPLIQGILYWGDDLKKRWASDYYLTERTAP